jgi:2-polyprenyl-3-methyl-5-hydroxy-6-metoxy-1,4-benzoquinol methylase
MIRRQDSPLRFWRHPLSADRLSRIFAMLDFAGPNAMLRHFDQQRLLDVACGAGKLVRAAMMSSAPSWSISRRG